jgi:hypothetical protein
MLIAVDSEYDVELGRFVVWFRGGVVVGCVCWRHMTMPDGAWVWWLLTADVNVRTLGGAPCGAPPPGEGL